MKSCTKLQVIAVVLLIAVLAVGCGSRWLAGGKLHFTQERYDKAKETFESAVAETPNSAEAHLWLGRAMAELREDEDAVSEILKAEELVTDRQPELKGEVANTKVSYWSKRYSSALSFAKAADGAKNSGDDAKRAEKLELAVEDFRRAILFCPDTVKNYLNLGRVLFQLERREDGMTAFEKARQLGGDDPGLAVFLFGVYRSLGVEALEKGARENSQEAYQTAISMFEEATTFQRKEADQIVIFFNIGFANTGLARLVDEGGKEPYLREAEKNYLKVLELDPSDVETIQNLADVYTNLGDFENALIYAQKLIDSSPWDPDVYLTMVALYNMKEEREKSVAYGMLRRVLRDDNPLAGGEARQQVSGTGPNSDMQKVLLDRGIPMQAYNYDSTTRGTYNIWYYWSEGRVYIFQKGKEVFRGGFRPLTDEEVQDVMGGN